MVPPWSPQLLWETCPAWRQARRAWWRSSCDMEVSPFAWNIITRAPCSGRVICLPLRPTSQPQSGNIPGSGVRWDLRCTAPAHAMGALRWISTFLLRRGLDEHRCSIVNNLDVTPLPFSSQRHGCAAGRGATASPKRNIQRRPPAQRGLGCGSATTASNNLGMHGVRGGR